MNKLDNLKQIKNTDKSNMIKYILDMPKNIQDSLNKAKKINLPQEYYTYSNICIVGMGGSGCAADILFNQELSNLNKPLALVRETNLPGWADKNTLVILISHSGETKEVIECFKDAVSREVKIIVIAERGKLEEMGKLENAVIYDYDTSAPPRASLGFQLGFLIAINNALSISPKINIAPCLKTIEKLNKKLNPESATENNMAKHLAFACFDHEIIVMASGILKSVARRWKNQFNENAKTFAFFDTLPEVMHNSIQGIDFPSRAKDDNVYFLLKNDFDNMYISSRFDFITSIFDKKKIQYENVLAQGDDVWSQKMSLTILGDWVSYYLAILNNIDPTPVPTITECKK
ncbi:MAG: SIS domain-containing protein [Patescibacteria group bacterium]